MQSILFIRNERLVQSNSKTKSVIIWIIGVPLVLFVIAIEKFINRLAPITNMISGWLKSSFRIIFPNSIDGDIMFMLFCIAIVMAGLALI